MRRIILTDTKQEPSLVRNEHIVPRFYLNKFADNEQSFWVYEKTKEPRRKSTKSQASEIDYFEYTINNRHSKNKYENWFKRMEGSAAAVFPAILDGTRQLTREEVMAWAGFISMLFLRTRKVRNQIVPKTMETLKEMFLPTDRVRETQYNLLMQGELIPFDELKAIAQQTWTQINTNPALVHMAGVNKSIATLAMDIIGRQWHTLEASACSFFVTSDCPVMTMKIGGNNAGNLGYGFAEPDVAIALTLSPRKIFVASPSNAAWPHILDDKHVQQFNTAVARFADRAVYADRSCPSVKHLVDEEINKVIFGHNAFKLVPLSA